MGTFKIPMTLYAENRRRLVENMKKNGHSGVILLKGGEQTTRHDTDHEDIFRQESYFHWAFRTVEADCFAALDVDTGKSTLFIPRRPEAYSIWMGTIHPPARFLKRYAVDACQFVDEIPTVMAADYKGKTIHVLYGRNSDSGNFAEPASFKGIEEFQVDRDSLFPIIANLRVFKTEAELEVMRYVSEVTSAAHVAVMRQVQVGWNEYQMEALFKFHTYNYGGCRHEAYTCICACGPSGATLHYGHAGAPNDRPIKDGQIGLLDMGAEYSCYCSDITCSYPVNGRFTQDQKDIYQGVLDAVIAVETAMKPVLSWHDMHHLALKTVTEALIKTGVLVGDAEEIIKSQLAAKFMPSGLGHLIGLDTHDVGGYLKGFPERSTLDGFKSLRTARDLEENMVLTVEPGIYFIESQVNMLLAGSEFDKYINKERLEQFRYFGGVRIEDVVLVKSDGIENFTQAPRGIDEIESVMSGGQWPPAEDKYPQLKRQFTTWRSAGLSQ